MPSMYVDTPMALVERGRGGHAECKYVKGDECKGIGKGEVVYDARRSTEMVSEVAAKAVAERESSSNASGYVGVRKVPGDRFQARYVDEPLGTYELMRRHVAFGGTRKVGKPASKAALGKGERVVCDARRSEGGVCGRRSRQSVAEEKNIIRRAASGYVGVLKLPSGTLPSVPRQCAAAIVRHESGPRSPAKARESYVMPGVPKEVAAAVREMVSETAAKAVAEEENIGCVNRRAARAAISACKRNQAVGSRYGPSVPSTVLMRRRWRTA